MYEISFSDGPYREPYKEENTQVYLNGVSYESGGLVLKFRDNQGNIYDKKTHNVLEMLISSEVLFGSELWKFKASLSHFYSSYNGTRKYVSSKASPDESFINSYKESSVAFKVFLSDQFSKIPNYGGYSSYPDLKNTSYPSYCQPIEQPANFKVELFEYQKKSISKMLSIERKQIELEANYNHIFDFGEVSINFNPNISNNEDNSKESKLTIKCNGGILSDEMGLGKTITSLALVALNPSTYTEQYKENLIYSNGTLIVCPSHLSKQWETEVKKIFPKANIIRLLTKNNHVNLTYKDIKDADIIIVTQQFLMNFKYYPQVHYQYCTPSNFVFSNRITSLNNVLQGWRDDNTDIMKEKQPNLEHFFFHRLIVDEGHEIFGLQLTNSSMARYMSDWLSQVNSNFKWFVSGTPFVNYDGLKKCLKFIDIKMEDKESGQDISSQDYNRFIKLWTYFNRWYTEWWVSLFIN